MSKVVFAVAQQDPDVAWYPSIMAILWDPSDESLDNLMTEINQEGFEPPDIPSSPGIWIWEGAMQGHWERRMHLQSVEFDGTWRHPTPYELAEISEGSQRPVCCSCSWEASW